LVPRAVEVAGGVLFAVAPFYPWIGTSSPDGFLTATVSLHDCTTWAWVLTGLGVAAALISLVPGEHYRLLGRILAVVYCVAAVASALSLFEAAGFGTGSQVGYGAAVAIGGWLAIVGGSLL
jgi:hypothetical protein